MLEFEISTSFLYIRKEKSDWLINVWIPNGEKGGRRLFWMLNSHYHSIANLSEESIPSRSTSAEKPVVYHPRRIGSLFASVRFGHFIKLHKAA